MLKSREKEFQRPIREPQVKKSLKVEDLHNNRSLGYRRPSEREPKPEKKECKPTSPCNANLFTEYWTDIQKNMKAEESKAEFDVTDNLGKHEVTDSLRSRMIDWMVEVLTNFRCSHQAYFMAVSLLD